MTTIVREEAPTTDLRRMSATDLAEVIRSRQTSRQEVIESHLRRAIEADPSFVPARLSLVRLLMRAERWAEAVAEAEKAVAVDPTVADAYYQLGRGYARVKRPEEARTAMATFERLRATQKERDETELREVVRRLADVRF